VAGAAGAARALPVVPHRAQAQAELGGYFSLPSDARFQPRIYTGKSRIPGRQGLARWEHRRCPYPAAVIMPPNLESSGRAVCSTTIRRLFNCSAIAYCFPLPDSSCQQPAEHQEPHCGPGQAGSLASSRLTRPLSIIAVAMHGAGQLRGQQAWHPKGDPSPTHGPIG